jgi:hypothetical protein
MELSDGKEKTPATLGSKVIYLLKLCFSEYYRTKSMVKLLTALHFIHNNFVQEK